MKHSARVAKSRPTKRPPVRGNKPAAAAVDEVVEPEESDTEEDD